MKCNCNENIEAKAKIKHVHGNVLKLAIPLTIRTIEVDYGEIVHTDSDFFPSNNYPVNVEFCHDRETIAFQAEMREGNIAYVEDAGTIPVGNYAITVKCKDDHGNPYRFKKKTVLSVVDLTADAGIESPIEYEATTWYLDAAIFLAMKGKDGDDGEDGYDGVGIEEITVQESDDAGGNNIVTFVLTDGRTQSFNVKNGSSIIDLELDKDSPNPVANSVITQRFRELDTLLAGLFGDVDYDSTNKIIRFLNKDKTSVIATLNAAPFIKDDAVTNFYISNNQLVLITTNRTFTIPFSSIFNPNNYYTKTQVDNRLSDITTLLYNDYVAKAYLLGRDNNVSSECMPHLVLYGMGEPYDEGDDSAVPANCPYFYNGYISIMSGGMQALTIGQPSTKVVYCNAKTNKLYRWNGTEFTLVGGDEKVVFGELLNDTKFIVKTYDRSSQQWSGSKLASHDYYSIYVDVATNKTYRYDDETGYTLISGGSSSGGEGTVTAIKMNNGTPIEPNAQGVVDLGNVITQHQDISHLATTDDVDNAIASIVSSAPQTLDTLKELADALGDDPNFATTMATALGNKVDKVNGKGLSSNDYTNEEKTKLGNLPTSDQLLDAFDDIDDAMSGKQDELTFDETPTENSNNPVTSGGVKSYVDSKPTVAGVTSNEDGTFTISLSTGDSYTIDLNHTHPQYVEKVTGKGLSTNDYTNAEKTKLGDLPTSAQLIQAFSDLQGDIPTKTSDLTNDSGFISTETDPTVPAWAKTPTKPTYTAQEVGALPANTSIPSKTSDLTNDSGFIDKALHYGTCTTAASTMPKVCTVETFPTTTSGNVTHAAEGTIIAVKFTNSDTNTTDAPELNVNGIGAKAIMYNNAIVTSTAKNTTIAGYAKQIAYYRYDPSLDDGNGAWEYLAKSVDSNSTYSQASLGQGYAVQSNSAAATAITASISSYALAAGGIVSIKFAYDVPANATLNISSKGAKAIYNRGAAITAGVIKAGDTATFIYSTYYHLISIDRNDEANLVVSATSQYDGNDAFIGYTLDKTIAQMMSALHAATNVVVIVDEDIVCRVMRFYDDGESERSILFQSNVFDDGSVVCFSVSDMYDNNEEIYIINQNVVLQTRTVNGKALSSDITLNASDVGALAEATVVEVSTAGAVSQALAPNTFYKFTGALTSLTLTLTAGTGLVVYAGKFSTGSGWGSNGLSIPATVTEATGNDEIAASKTYEFSILDNVIVIKEV